MNLDSDPILRKYWLQSLARELLPGERVVFCLRRQARLNKNVEIRHSHKVGRAWYANLQTCGSVWACAICAAKITERRKVELETAITDSRFFVVLATYTMHHESGYALATLLDILKVAHRKLKSGRQYQWLKDEYGLIGSFISTEVTYGINGWHPHLHEMLIGEYDFDIVSTAALRQHLKRRWSEVLKQSGSWASFTHGVEITHARDYERTTKQKASEYIAKSPWNIESELTKSNLKRGRVKGRSPVQLLTDYGNGDKQAGELWVEFAIAMKGKHYLTASRGIKDLLQIGTETDNDISQEDEQIEDYNILASIDAWQWRVICAKDKRGELLVIAQQGDEEKVRNYVESLINGT